MCVHNTVTREMWVREWERTWACVHGGWEAGTSPALFQVKVVLLFNTDE